MSPFVAGEVHKLARKLQPCVANQATIPHPAVVRFIAERHTIQSRIGPCAEQQAAEPRLYVKAKFLQQQVADCGTRDASAATQVCHEPD
jgi:hypothetical protein